MMIGKNMMPRDDQTQFNISVRLPEGSSLAATTTTASEAIHAGAQLLHDGVRAVPVVHARAGTP